MIETKANRYATVLIAITAALAASDAQGGWVVTSITDDSSVSNAGVQVVANNLGSGAAAASVNGVSFGTSASGLASLGNGGGDFWVAGAGTTPTAANTSVGMDALLSTLVFTNAGASGTVTVGGLAVGVEYKMQMLLADSAFGPRNMNVASNGETRNVTFATGAGAVAKNAAFTFTATATSQAFTITDVAGDAVLNAYAVHQVGIGSRHMTLLTISDAAQLDGSGMVVAAENFGDSDPTPRTVAATGGNITFVNNDAAIGASGFDASGGLPSGVGGDLGAVLNDLYYKNTAGSATITATGLQVGRAYRAQLLLDVTTQAARGVDINIEGIAASLLVAGNQLFTFEWIALDTQLDITLTNAPGPLVASGLVVSLLSVPTPTALSAAVALMIASTARRRRSPRR